MPGRWRASDGADDMIKTLLLFVELFFGIKLPCGAFYVSLGCQFVPPVFQGLRTLMPFLNTCLWS